MNKQFRAWDSLECRYLIDFLIDDEGKVYENGFSLNIVKGAIVEQWTGLSDKTGKLIFEGDIIQRLDYVGKVCFDFGQFYSPSFYEAGFDYVGDIFGEGLKEIEVIGNIHTDGDLLK